MTPFQVDAERTPHEAPLRVGQLPPSPFRGSRPATPRSGDRAAIQKTRVSRIQCDESFDDFPAAVTYGSSPSSHIS